jgi:hypothetical protein
MITWRRKKARVDMLTTMNCGRLPRFEINSIRKRSLDIFPILNFVHISLLPACAVSWSVVRDDGRGIRNVEYSNVPHALRTLYGVRVSQMT